MKVLITTVFVSMSLFISATPLPKLDIPNEKHPDPPISSGKQTLPPPLNFGALESAMLFANSISKIMPTTKTENTPASNHGHGTEIVNGVMNTLADGARLMSSALQFLPAIGMLGSRAVKLSNPSAGSPWQFTQGNPMQSVINMFGLKPSADAPTGKQAAQRGKETPSGKSSTSFGKVASVMNNAFSGSSLQAHAMSRQSSKG